MIYQANKRQFGALEGLAHWCAEYYYTLERFGADDAEMPAIRKDMSFALSGAMRWACRTGRKTPPLHGPRIGGPRNRSILMLRWPEEGSPAREVQRRDIVSSPYIDNIFCLQI